MFSFLHSTGKLDRTTRYQINIRFKPYGINAQPTCMSVSCPVTSLLSAQFSDTGIRHIQRLEKFIEIFGIRKLKHKLLQCLSIFKSVIDRLIQTFNMEKILQIFKVFHKEIKKILTIGPITKQ